MRIMPVGEDRLRDATEVHAKSWREAHQTVCSPTFLETHTAERQEAYLRSKLESGSRLFLLTVNGQPVGTVSLKGDEIADLYVLPEEQGKGYGSKLLSFVIGQTHGTPRLWILENNAGAERLYRRFGFRPTGRRTVHPGGVDEIEMAQTFSKT